MVRAGRKGEQEQEALEGNFVTIHWIELPDLSPIQDREALATLYREAIPNESPAQVAIGVGQVWAFRKRIEPGHLVILPLHAQSAIAIGKVTGPYCYRTDLGDDIHHIRQVQWIRTDIPRTSFQQDLLRKLNLPPAVYQISRNNAEERIQAMLNGQKDPGIKDSGMIEAEEGEVSETEVQDEVQDIEQSATDQILGYIQSRFTRHKLADLVDAALRAEGYLTQVSPPGPDGGVDILAGSGPMGFGSPRLCVQVKSSPDPVDVTVLRGLQGILQNFGADQGLLVCWGGFKTSVIQEARRSFFTIRLWDSGDLLQVLLKNYDKLPADLQAELPLKQIWALVLEE
jgi:restriction system protein